MAELDTSVPSNMPSTIEISDLKTTDFEAQPVNGVSTTDLTITNNITTIASEEPDATKKTKKLVRRKRRPARPQVDASTMKSEPPPQTGTIFNIWYNKWSGGDREDKYLSKTHAAGRCNVVKDSGYTRADKVPGSYFCLFFAKGLCPRGHECEYLHRLPGLHDLFNPNVDCFGRDKHSDYRDDMGGVGSFMRQNRTLYVGRIHVTDDIEEVVARHFAEWGQIDRTRVLTSRGVAFVTYTNEANSQFAKEAMAHQSLDHNEILNVRWATMDPNPMAQKREARKIEEQAAEAVRRALPADYIQAIEEGRDPAEVKRRRIESSNGDDDEVPRLEAHEEHYLIHDAPPDQDSNHGGGEGILSNSTLAALKDYSSQNNGKKMALPRSSTAPGGPLVGYGSDDDSD